MLGSVINGRRRGGERCRDIERRPNLDHSTQTRNSENVHFQREPFQSTMAVDHSAGGVLQVDDWIAQETNRSRKPLVKATLSPPPLLELESFDGDHTCWTKFSAWFKALIQDVVDLDY